MTKRENPRRREREFKKYSHSKKEDVILKDNIKVTSSSNLISLKKKIIGELLKVKREKTLKKI